MAVLEAGPVSAKAAILATLSPPGDGQRPWPLPAIPERPGRPPEIREGQPPRRRRGLANPLSRLQFLHAIWHIECTAIDLAVLCSLCAPDLPAAFHVDQLRIAREEAEHATLIADLLAERKRPVGSDAVHHRLWDAARACRDLGDHLVVIPRFLEARGLDVNADLIPHLRGVDDQAAAIMTRIYHDEIGHVGCGTHWHRVWCSQRGLDPEQHFRQVIAHHQLLCAPTPAPLDREGRRQAGFSDRELEHLLPSAGAAPTPPQELS